MLQARCWLRLHHPKTRLRLEDFIPRQLLVYLETGAGCWLEASAPHHVDLSTGCSSPHNVVASMVGNPQGSHSVFYDPASEITHCHFCKSYWLTVRSGVQHKKGQSKNGHI